jgi:hypothetical protein
MGGARALAISLVLCGCDGRALPITPAPGPECERVGFHLSELRTIDADERLFSEGGAPIAAKGRVYYGARATTGSNSSDDLDLFSVDAESGAVEQLTRDDLETIMLDAREGSVLCAERVRGASYKTPWRLILKRDGVGQDLGEHLLPFHGPGDHYADAARRLLDGGNAAWATESQIFHYDGKAVVAVAAAKLASPPFLAGGTLVFSAHDGKDTEIYRSRGGELEQLTDNESDDDWPVLVGDEVIWLCDGGICRLRPGHPLEVVEAGECAAPSAGGGSAAWACGGHVSRYAPGRPITSTPERAGVRPAAVRVEGAFLAWVEPDQGGYPGQGTLFVSAGEQTLEVARVGLPCLVCDAYWPPLQVSLVDGLLAWSYAQPEQPEQPGGHRYAYVRLVSELRCP